MPQPAEPTPQGFQAARLPKPQPEAKVGNKPSGSKPLEKSVAKKKSAEFLAFFDIASSWVVETRDKR